MKIALTGFANSGKTTIFNAITHQKIETSPSITTPDLIHRGIIQVHDKRLEKISHIVNPKKTTFASIECIDVAGILRKNLNHNLRVIREIIDADALIYVLRGFEDPSVPYQFDSINPMRDFQEIEYELLIFDLELVTKRIERMDEQKKKGQKINSKEKEIMDFFRENLEQGKPLRMLSLDEETSREIRHLNFITLKPILPIVNVDEKSFNDKKFKELGFIRICGKLESEISQLSEEDEKNFLEAMGIDEAVSNKIARKAYEILDFISFFTAGPQEVRAWSIKRGTKAVTAAGKIHSDIQRGFIKAEVISFDDFLSLNGDLNLAKQRGILRFEGKEYEVKDGDIINFRFKI